MQDKTFTSYLVLDIIYSTIVRGMSSTMVQVVYSTGLCLHTDIQGTIIKYRCKDLYKVISALVPSAFLQRLTMTVFHSRHTLYILSSLATGRWAGMFECQTRTVCRQEWPTKPSMPIAAHMNNTIKNTRNLPSKTKFASYLNSLQCDDRFSVF